MTAPANNPEPSPDDGTGLPGLRSWRAVYAIVMVVFILYVVFLTWFGRAFS